MSDVTFGRVVSGRSALDYSLQHVVGPSVGFVPVRVMFDSMPSMKEAQAAVQAHTGELRDNSGRWES
jgi:hypothetical protein